MTVENCVYRQPWSVYLCVMHFVKFVICVILYISVLTGILVTMGDTEADGQQNGAGAVGGAPVVNQSFDGLSSIAPFRTDSDPDRLAALWKRWKRSFNLYLKSKVITDDARKQACLLHVAGPAVQDDRCVFLCGGGGR